MNACPEGEYRASLSEGEFWAHVYASLSELPFPFDEDSLRDGVEAAMTKPCTLCGATGPCGYDSEGRSMIHTENDFDV